MRDAINDILDSLNHSTAPLLSLTTTFNTTVIGQLSMAERDNTSLNYSAELLRTRDSVTLHIVHTRKILTKLLEYMLDESTFVKTMTMYEILGIKGVPLLQSILSDLGESYDK